jgi:RND superfamily putative drug exporter
MFSRLGRVAAAARRVLPLAAWAVLAAGTVIVAARAGLVPAGAAAVDRLRDAGVLPARGESAQADRLARTAFPGPAKGTALLVVDRVDGARLTAADGATVDRVLGRLAAADIPTVSGLGGPLMRMSPDGTVAVVPVGFARGSSDAATLRAVGELRARTADLFLGTTLRARFTGDAASAYDSQGNAAVVELGAGAAIVGLFLLGRYVERPRTAPRPTTTVAAAAARTTRRDWPGIAVGRQ